MGPRPFDRGKEGFGEAFAKALPLQWGRDHSIAETHSMKETFFFSFMLQWD